MPKGCCAGHGPGSPEAAPPEPPLPLQVARQLPLLPLQGDGSLQPAASKLVLPPVKPEAHLPEQAKTVRMLGR